MRAPWRSGVLVAVVLTLALAIGANTAFYSIVRGVLLRPLPFTAPDRVVLLSEFDRISGTTREAFSVPDYYDLRARTHVFAGLAGFASRPYSLAGDGSEPVVLHSVHRWIDGSSVRSRHIPLRSASVPCGLRSAAIRSSGSAR